MRGLLRYAAIAALSISVLGCAGATHYAPQGTSADIAAAQARIAASGRPQPVQWTPQQMQAMVGTATQRLQAAAGPLCAYMQAPVCRFTVTISNESAPNAWASGVGQIAITGSMLQLLRDETEVAAVLGHEMAHHMAGHLNRAATNQAVGGLLGAVLAGAAVYAGGGQGGGAQDLVTTGAQLGASVGRLTYSREMEREADYIGAYLLARAGYDLDRAGGVWFRMAGSGRTTSGILDTHPTSPERLAAWQHIVAEVRASPNLLPRRVN